MSSSTVCQPNFAISGLLEVSKLLFVMILAARFCNFCSWLMSVDPAQPHQSNDVENCLVLSPIYQIRFSDLPGFTRSFLPVEIGDFLQKAPVKNLQKRAKTSSKIPFVLLPSNNDFWMCLCILSSWENGIPLKKLFTLGRRLFNLPKRKHVLNRAESHHCEVNKLGIFACNFSTFFKVSQRDSF